MVTRTKLMLEITFSAPEWKQIAADEREEHRGARDLARWVLSDITPADDEGVMVTMTFDEATAMYAALGRTP